MKRWLLILILLLPFAAALVEEKTVYSRGDAVADFTLTAWDGRELSMSAALAEKEAVLLHFFSPPAADVWRKCRCSRRRMRPTGSGLAFS